VFVLKVVADPSLLHLLRRLLDLDGGGHRLVQFELPFPMSFLCLLCVFCCKLFN
jgi:hypothetical protein